MYDIVKLMSQRKEKVMGGINQSQSQQALTSPYEVLLLLRNIHKVPLSFVLENSIL